MLAQSLPGSARSSAPPSPRPALIKPVRTRSSALRDSLPPNAEFVGSSPAPPSESHGISETAFSPMYFEKFFMVEKELGRGGRGVVLLVKHILGGVSVGQFACKRVPIGDDHAWLEKVLVEVQLLQALSHQNLVSYRHVWLEDFQLSTFGPRVPCAFILQQYCNGGDLHNFVCGPAQATTTTEELKERIRRRSKGEADLPRKTAEPKRLQFEQIYSFFRDITAGLRYLHGQQFVHRDLKPSNCLLHIDPDGTRVLVSDFGEVQYESATRKSTGATGTISYCAPEVLQRIAPGGPLGNFTFKSDIFSLGMILHFLCFANLPYRCSDVLHEEREDIEALRIEIVSWQGFNDLRRLRPELPDKLYEFLKRLLSLDPDDRPTAEEVHHGIRTGGLDEQTELRRRNSASPEELTPGRRVQAVDSPMRDLSPSKQSNRQNAKAPGVGHAQASFIRRRQTAHESFGSYDGEIIRNKSQESGSSGPLRRDVILRPSVTSPIPSPTHSQSPEPHSPHLLLPPPEPSTIWPRLTATLRIHISSSLLRATLLSVKLLSVLQPCIWSSSSINPIVVYPLIVVAILETAITDYSVWQLLLGVATHVSVVLVAISTSSLCLSSRSGNLWEPD